ncbi:hypothetical protein GQ457_01G033070 [Hibiscus cannabinus]
MQTPSLEINLNGILLNWPWRGYTASPVEGKVAFRRFTFEGLSIAKLMTCLTWRAIPDVLHKRELMSMNGEFDFVSKSTIGMKRVVTKPMTWLSFILAEMAVKLRRIGIRQSESMFVTLVPSSEC